MEKVKLFIELTRLNKPIGFMLLFWPSLWGLTLAYNKHENLKFYFYYIFLFFLGSILMRSAGCIVNDLIDKDYDKKVQRTKKRPIASGKISFFESLFYVFVLCFVSLIILLQFNYLTIILGLISMPLAFCYPFMKRFTYWPQLFLGITFNWGIIMGWASIENRLTLEPIILYLAAIFWTLGYDTIYGFQDIKDDEIIGVKSTSIRFKNNYKTFIGSCYFISVLFFIFLGFFKELYIDYFILLLFPIMFFIYQLINLNKTNPLSCLHLFKSNSFFGLLIFFTILSSTN